MTMHTVDVVALGGTFEANCASANLTKTLFVIRELPVGRGLVVEPPVA